MNKSVFNYRTSRAEAHLSCDHILRARRAEHTPSVHFDAFTGKDEFAAAFDSCRAQFELFDGVVFNVDFLCNEKLIREPQESVGFRRPDAREFLETVVAQSMHSH